MIAAFTKAAINVLLVGLEIAIAAWLYRRGEPGAWIVVVVALVCGISAGTLERSCLGLSRPWLLVPEAGSDSLALVARRWQGRASRALRWAVYVSCVTVSLLVHRSLAAGLAGILAFEAARDLIGIPAICWPAPTRALLK